MGDYTIEGFGGGCKCGAECQCEKTVGVIEGVKD